MEESGVDSSFAQPLIPPLTSIHNPTTVSAGHCTEPPAAYAGVDRIGINRHAIEAANTEHSAFLYLVNIIILSCNVLMRVGAHWVKLYQMYSIYVNMFCDNCIKYILTARV